jgi:hypothetical protein
VQKLPEYQSPLPSTGKGRIYYDGAVHDATWTHSRSLADYEVLVTLDDGREFPVSDNDPRMGFIYMAPDSGSEMNNILVLLEDGEADPVGIPDRASLTASAYQAMAPVYASIAARRTDPDDLDYARQLFTSPEALLRMIQKTGSVDAARTRILNEVFNL